MIRLFNPQPRVQVLEPAPGLRCVVLDDVLLEPETLVSFAASQRFEAAEGNLYPGQVTGLSAEFDLRLRDLFWQHARGPLALRRSLAELAGLFRDAQALAPADFSARHGIAPGYPAADSAHFDCVASVPAAWNRMIIYDGGGYHSAAIDRPDLLSDDPTKGRLTLNGFFPCRRQAAPARHP